MVNALIFPTALLERLRTHVAQPGRVEQVAFMFTSESDDDLEVVDVFPVPTEWFQVQSGHHVSLKDEVRGPLIMRAWVMGAGLAEAHSHLGDMPARFSPTDIGGLEDWAPHVRWRLGGKPYAALVFGESTFDALIWAGDSAGPTVLGEIRAHDGKTYEPTGLTAHDWGRSTWT